MKYFAVQRRCTAYDLDESAPLVWGVVDSMGGFRPLHDEQKAREWAEVRNRTLAEKSAGAKD